MRDRRFAGEKTKVNVKTIFSKKENPLRQFLSYILVKTYKYILFCLLNISRLCTQTVQFKLRNTRTPHNRN